MRLTEAEKQFIALRRERIKLDSVDWSREPYVTYRDMLEMSRYTAYGILADPLFRYCIRDQVYYNTRNDVGANDVQ